MSTGTKRRERAAQFYEIIAPLAAAQGHRTLAEIHGRQHSPKRRVYFILEPGETLWATGAGEMIFRAGAHNGVWKNAASPTPAPIAGNADTRD